MNILFYDDVIDYLTSNGRVSGERCSVKDLEVTGRGFIEAPNQRLSERAQHTPKLRQLMNETARSDHVCVCVEFLPLCKSYQGS